MYSARPPIPAITLDQLLRGAPCSGLPTRVELVGYAAAGGAQGLWHPDPLALQSPERPGGASRTSRDGENYARQTAGKSGGQNTNDGNATSKLVLADHLFECSLPPLLMPCYPRARLHP